MDKLNVGFIWFGLDGRFGHWNDGLHQAMRLLEQVHNVHYFDTNGDWSKMDVLLFWEALCTGDSKDKDEFFKVYLSPQKKILLFAGGPITPKWISGFDLFMVESQINEDEFKALDVPHMRGFGVNTEIMKPEVQPKMFDAYFPATCASWKRLDLFSKALGAKGVVSGREQKTDPMGFIEARKNKTLVLPELPYNAVNSLYNASHCVVNTSSYWGGGQRTTLEALAAGVPVIVMEDSPKNREYIEESGCGLVCKPTVEAIRESVEKIKTWSVPETRNKCVNYIKSKWTAEHYRDALIKGIEYVNSH